MRPLSNRVEYESSLVVSTVYLLLMCKNLHVVEFHAFTWKTLFMTVVISCLWPKLSSSVINPDDVFAHTVNIPVNLS